MDSIFSQLSQTCPVGRRSDDCPFHKFDSMTMEQVVDYVQKMNGSERRHFIRHHKDCLAIRKTEKSKKKSCSWVGRFLSF